MMELVKQGLYNSYYILHNSWLKENTEYEEEKNELSLSIYINMSNRTRVEEGI